MPSGSSQSHKETHTQVLTGPMSVLKKEVKLKPRGLVPVCLALEVDGELSIGKGCGGRIKVAGKELVWRGGQGLSSRSGGHQGGKVNISSSPRSHQVRSRSRSVPDLHGLKV